MDLLGSYANIDGGRIAEALADLTGGLPGRIESLTTNSEEKWQTIKSMGNVCRHPPLLSHKVCFSGAVHYGSHFC